VVGVKSFFYLNTYSYLHKYIKIKPAMKIKRVLSIVFVIFFVIAGQAQEWQTDFETAKTIASKESRKIIMVFQGSDWCAPCIKLDTEIWSSEEFKAYAKNHFVMLKVDFPRKKANALDPAQQGENARLAETFNKKGFFPFVVVLDAQGNKLGETGYKKMAPGDYIQHLLSFK